MLLTLGGTSARLSRDGAAVLELGRDEGTRWPSAAFTPLGISAIAGLVGRRSRPPAGAHDHAEYPHLTNPAALVPVFVFFVFFFVRVAVLSIVAAEVRRRSMAPIQGRADRWARDGMLAHPTVTPVGVRCRRAHSRRLLWGGGGGAGPVMGGV